MEQLKLQSQSAISNEMGKRRLLKDKILRTGYATAAYLSCPVMGMTEYNGRY
jgi:hypothetical protein